MQPSSYFLKVIFKIGLLLALCPLKSEASKLRPVLVASTYGVVAGALAGLGSLAFYDAPTEHLSNVAVGTSLGLYVGLAIGVYGLWAPSQSYDPENPINLEEEGLGSAQKNEYHVWPLLSWSPRYRSLGVGLNF